MIKRIKIGCGSCGIAAGAATVRDALQKRAGAVPVVEVGCIGHCYAEPMVEVETDNGSYWYNHVEAKNEHLDAIFDCTDFHRFEPAQMRGGKETPLVSALAGRIAPTSLDEYIQNGGFEALKQALATPPDDVVKTVKDSGLRGRGGGGFPTGIKWTLLAAKTAEKKVLICNADEGDPGAFMDRSIMESVPYQVLEGMFIAAHATGSTDIYIYCRAEYPLAIRNLEIAVDELKKAGLNVVNGRELNVVIKEGAGAFVCGEETAMIHSLEGKRGMPRYRPPYPTDSGYHGWPTVINNVETFASIPVIIRLGVQEYRKYGTENSPGTKIFALAGDVARPGLVEVPIGMTIGEVVYTLGGAVPGEVKAVQIGGPSGGCIPADLFDTPVDYDSLTKLGAIMGSGGLIVIGNRCMVETARYFLEFTARESCGKCTFCRVGTTRMLEILERITHGKGVPDDVNLLTELGTKIKQGSLCGLGQTAPNPVLSTFRYFMDEYTAHVEEHTCPALECGPLVDVALDQDKCIECGQCIRVCPVDAVSGDYVIDNSVCTRCNSCIEVCPKDAIRRAIAVKTQ